MEIDISKVDVRKVELADIHELVTYRMIYLEELQGERSEEYLNRLREELTAYFTKSIQHGALYAAMASYNGETLAFGAMIIKEIPGDFTQSSYLEGDILNMFTLQKARKKGISSLVLQELIRKAKVLGLSKIALHTTRDGEHMYRKHGFKDPEYPYMELGLGQ